jgi:hypothetical protein
MPVDVRDDYEMLDTGRINWLESLGGWWQIQVRNQGSRFEFASPELLVTQKTISRSTLRETIDAARAHMLLIDERKRA